MVRLQGEQGQLLAIECTDSGVPGTPDEGNLLLKVTVEVGGYSGADEAWVLADDWRGFLSELRQLEELRQGQAALQGPGPYELELLIRATDRLGHMAVSGFVGRVTFDGFALKLEFGFAFDAGMLPTLVREFEALGG